MSARLTPELLEWYDRSARDLPWRRTNDPYAILVSEFMLQQTQVQTVIPYYHAFLERFPTPTALAEATVDEVLQLWKGLGYYRRARNLHEAARALVEKHAARVPTEYDAVRALPGVGDYTAAAVVSIAFDLPYPVLDGNVARVVSRLLCIDAPVDKSATKREMLGYLHELLPKARRGDFNQAMMELGATLCLPTSPDCGRCPFRHACRAHEAGRERELPVKSVKEKVKIEERTVVVARVNDRVWLRRRPDEGLLARMWEFPHVLGHGQASVEMILEDVTAEALRLDSLSVGAESSKEVWECRTLGRVEHRFSHLLWRLDVVEARMRLGEYQVNERAPEWTESRSPRAEQWTALDSVEQMALPRAMQRVWKLCDRPPEPTLPF